MRAHSTAYNVKVYRCFANSTITIFFSCTFHVRTYRSIDRNCARSCRLHSLVYVIIECFIVTVRAQTSPSSSSCAHQSIISLNVWEHRFFLRDFVFFYRPTKRHIFRMVRLNLLAGIVSCFVNIHIYSKIKTTTATTAQSKTFILKRKNICYNLFKIIPIATFVFNSHFDSNWNNHGAEEKNRNEENNVNK